MGTGFDDDFGQFDAETGEVIPVDGTGKPSDLQRQVETEAKVAAAAKASVLAALEATLPTGGAVTLFSRAEVDLFDQTASHYATQFNLTEHNDLLAVGGIAQLQVGLHRTQQALNNRVPEFDDDGDPTGRYVAKRATGTEQKELRKEYRDALSEIRAAEKALGVDKAQRDAGGAQNVAAYIQSVKSASRAYGLHLSERLKAYEAFNMDLKTRLRILYNADAEDRRYHAISEQSICDWAMEELKKIEDIDKQYAQEKGRIFIGKVK